MRDANRPAARLPVGAVLLLLAVGAVWLRSTREADMLVFFTRSGALQGVASQRGGVVLFISELRFSDNRRLTFAYDHTSADVFDEILATLAAGQEKTHKALGFE